MSYCVYAVGSTLIMVFIRSIGDCAARRSPITSVGLNPTTSFFQFVRSAEKARDHLAVNELRVYRTLEKKKDPSG